MSEKNDNQDRTQSFASIAAGMTISQYRIIRLLGAGGMGEVYLAEDTRLDRQVALKFLSPHLCQDEDCRKRFTREAQAAAKLNHPQVVTVYEVGEYHRRPFIAMQYVEGRSLRYLIRRGEHSLNEALDIAILVGEGLREAHEAGIVHRDIKPANILIDKKGNPRLVDFGLAHVADKGKLTKTGSTVGTAGYMSPEQVRGEKVDSRSDLFSFGIVLYELIAGKAPFVGGTDAAVLHSITHDRPEPLARYKSGMPVELQRISDKTLEKDRDLRYQHIDDLLADLRRVKRGIDSGEAEVLVAGRPARPSRYYLAPLGLFSAVLFLLLVLFAYPTSRRFLLERLSPGPAFERKHLAVLPFTSLGDVQPSQAFCDGLTETIASKLTQLEQFQRSLWVVPTSEVRSRNVKSPGEARQQLGVTLVVTGSVQRFNDRIRMTVNLVDAKNQRQLRSTVIDESPANVSALQDSTVLELAEMLELQLRPGERGVLAAGGTTAPEAYDRYIEGRGYLHRYREEWGGETPYIDTSIILFQRAAKIDPRYALAFAALGEAYWRKYESTKEQRWTELALSNGQHAVELNDRLSDAHVTLGLVYKGTGQYEKAVAEFRQALQLNPVNHDASVGLAQAYEALNDFVKAESTYHRIIALKPDYWYGYLDLGFFYFCRGRTEDALEQLRMLTALEPTGVAAWNDIGGLFFYLNKRTEARRAWERSLEIKPNYPAYSNLGSLYQMEMDYTAAAGMYEKALKLNDRDYQVWFNLASAYRFIPGAEQESRAACHQAIQRAEQQRAMNPRDPMLLSHLADCYTMIGDSTRAGLLGEQALSEAPDNILILARIGIVYEKLGNRERALDCISKALSRGFPAADLEQFPELKDLRTDRRFQELLGKTIGNASEAPDRAIRTREEKP